jgi:phosphoribosylformimino-5-aminoimidazole carboxamide ribotide isomerase
MILTPAIDLIGGRCVRLKQGDFARQTSYALDPRQVLADFAAAGAKEAHLVDLDGARAREPRQHDLFVGLLRDSPLALQLAGGIRTCPQVERLLDAGAERVVIGSLAVDDPTLFSSMLDRFGGERLTLALDVRLVGGQPVVSTHGWATDSGLNIDTVLGRFPAVRHLLVTDIGRDGMLSGPNLPLLRGIARSYPDIALQASGGVADLQDIAALAVAGAARAIVGKAIWEGRFTVAEGIASACG